MSRSLPVAFVFVAWSQVVSVSAARADVIVDHQPLNTGGPAADTLFIDMFGDHTWELAADDFTLTVPASIGHVRWWGFYGSSSGSGSNQPPTGPETIRIRFYTARTSDSLPDSTGILYEQSVLNPPRVWTGRIIGGGTGAREYVFDTSLASPVQLAADLRFWIEIVQLGDLDSLFRWEVSISDRNGIAYLNPLVPDWQLTGNYSLAVQLSSVPEPATVFLVLLSLIPGRKLSNGFMIGHRARGNVGDPRHVDA